MLSIIIVNYKSVPYIINCINSVLRFTPENPFEWIVVDNDSNDHGREIVTQKFPFVKWIETGYNAGFARANNAGIKIAGGDAMLLLNADTYVTDNSIEMFYKDFIASDFGAAVPQLYFADEKRKQLSGFYVPAGGLNTLLPLPVIGTVLKKAGNALSVKTHTSSGENAVENVDWVHGACFMLKREVIDKAGLLDEDFFLYSEEIEWCSRIKKYYKIGLFTKYKVIHLEGQSSNQLFENPAKGYYDIYSKKGRQLLLSNLVRIRKEFGVFWFLFHILVYLTEIPVLFIYKIFHREIQPVSFAKNVFYIMGKMFIIIRNKPYFYKAL